MTRTDPALSVWDPADEEGLTPSQMVALAKAIQREPIEIRWTDHGFVVAAKGGEWTYGVLSELLEDVGEWK